MITKRECDTSDSFDTYNTSNESFDTLNFIIAWEEGTATDEQIIDGFQHLIDSGEVWHLQGCYGRTAASLIEDGFCRPPMSRFN